MKHGEIEKEEKQMKCGNKCPYWNFNLRFPIGLGPVCKKYMLPLFAAREKCFSIAGSERAKAKPITANPWPGLNSGYGTLTRIMMEDYQ